MKFNFLFLLRHELGGLVPSWGPVTPVPPGLLLLLLGDGSDGGWDGVEAQVLQQLLSVWVDIKSSVLAVDGVVKSGDLRNVLILALTLLLLKLEGDTTDGPTADTLHQVGGVSGNLVPQPLGRNDSDLITDTLVGLEVKSELRVVSFDNDLSGLLDGLGSYSSHVCGFG